MKKNVKFRSIFLALYLGTLFGALPLNAGPGYPACFSVCLATCMRTFVTCNPGVDCSHRYIQCCQVCAANCMAMCFSKDTKIFKLENGEITEKNIEEIQAN